MKRFMSLFLAVFMFACLCFSSVNAQNDTFSTPMLKKSKAFNTTYMTKTTGNGVSSTVATSSMTDNAIFFFRVWKNSSWKASDGLRKSGVTDFSLTTLYDGYGNPRLWKGVNYYLAVTHSSASNVYRACTSGEWEP